MILEKISSDIIKALKAKDKQKLAVLRYVKSVLRNKEIDLKKKLSEEEEQVELHIQVKKREQAVELYQKGGRQDLADRELKEIEIISSYLPRPLSKEEMEKEVEQALKENEATSMQDMGKVMKYLKEKLGTKADGKVLSNIVKLKLSS